MNRSTYYKHFFGEPAPRVVENQDIRAKILELYAKSDKRFGVLKMRKRLSVEYGINISIGRVSRLMRGMQLPKMSTVKPKYVVMKSVTETVASYPNLLGDIERSEQQD